jgi:nicotinamidase-related amidase
VAQTALLVIDLQKGLFNREHKIYNENRLIENITHLINKCRQMKIPIIFIQHTNKGLLLEDSPDWQIHSGIDVQDIDLCFTKKYFSLFKEKKIVKELENMGVKKLIITGLLTHGCVKGACLDAKKLGYEVVLVEDGHSNYDRNAKEIVDRWNQYLANQGVTVLPTAKVFC